MSAATAQPQQGGKSEHNVFLRVLAHRLTLVQSVQRMWRSEGACPALFYLTELEEPSVTSDVLRCAFAATAAPIKSSPDGEFHFSLPTYPFAADAEGITSDTVTHAPGVDWVEHLTAALLQMLTSKFVDHTIVGLSGASVLASRVTPLLRAHSTTPMSAQDGVEFKILQQQASFTLPHLQLLLACIESLASISHAQFSRKRQEATRALQKALTITSLASE